MNYSTYLTSRWHVYAFGGEINSNGNVTKDNDQIGVLHLDLKFKIIDILEDIDKYIKIIITIEEFKSGNKVKYKEKIELKKQLKKVVKDYIKNRLEKGFEYELFSIE